MSCALTAICPMAESPNSVVAINESLPLVQVQWSYSCYDLAEEFNLPLTLCPEFAALVDVRRGRSPIEREGVSDQDVCLGGQCTAFLTRGLLGSSLANSRQ